MHRHQWKSGAIFQVWSPRHYVEVPCMTDAHLATSREDAPAASPEVIPHPDMVTVLVEVRLTPEQSAVALAELLATIKRWVEEPGFQHATVFRDPDDSAHLLILEAFTSAQALQTHEV